MPVGVWDIEQCAGGDRLVCFVSADGTPALFVDESRQWWAGESNAQGQTAESISVNDRKQPAVGCVVPTDACASGSAVAVGVEAHPNDPCVLGVWRYGCVDSVGADGHACADDDDWLSLHAQGYTCEEIARLGICEQLASHGISWACGCSCHFGPSAPEPEPEPEPAAAGVQGACVDTSPFIGDGIHELSCDQLLSFGLTSCDSDAGTIRCAQPSPESNPLAWLTVDTRAAWGRRTEGLRWATCAGSAAARVRAPRALASRW